MSSMSSLFLEEQILLLAQKYKDNQYNHFLLQYINLSKNSIDLFSLKKEIPINLQSTLRDILIHTYDVLSTHYSRNENRKKLSHLTEGSPESFGFSSKF
ncbi:MAG: hypothetical protein VXZ40_03285 [Nanoarchaeota archaeon]|nr:hypothetical protein [Nanoarchaeota archaeon]